MKRTTKCLFMISILIFLTGCWDERFLRESRTVYLSGVDIDEDGRYHTTAIIRDMNISESSRGEISISAELVSGWGNSIRETTVAIDRSVAGDFDLAQGRVIILGNDIARGNIYYILDPVYRAPRVNINAKLIVSDRTANELITHLQEEEVEKGEYLYEMIRSSENHTESQEMTLRSVRTYLFDEGKDFMLPYLQIDEETNEVKVTGSALFHDLSYTGEYLSSEETTLLLLFKGERSREAILTSDLAENKSISFNAKNVERKMEFEQGEHVRIHITLRMDVEVHDYPPDQLNKPERRNYLNEQLSNVLTEDAERIFSYLAETKSDILGLGREMMAYHPVIWEDIQGDNYYENILIIPEVIVNITSSGTMS